MSMRNDYSSVVEMLNLHDNNQITTLITYRVLACLGYVHDMTGKCQFVMAQVTTAFPLTCFLCRIMSYRV